MPPTVLQNDPFMTHHGPVGGQTTISIENNKVAVWSPWYVAWVATGLYSINLIIFTFVIPTTGVFDARWTLVIISLSIATAMGYPEPSPFQRRLYDWTPLISMLVATITGLFLGHLIYQYLLEPHYILKYNRSYEAKFSCRSTS